MKELTNKHKKLINAYIDGEIDGEKKYQIEKIINQNENARKFYDDILNTKKLIHLDFNNIKASKDFERKLFLKLNEIPQKKNRIAILNRIIDYITLPRLSYAVGTILFLFIFGAALYRFGKNSANFAVAQSDTNTKTENTYGFKEKPDLAMRGNPKGFSESSSASKGVEQKKAEGLPKSKSEKAKNVEEDATEVIKETQNQKKARRVFDSLEKKSGEKNVIVKKNYKQGVDQFKKGNFSESRKHFLLVVQKANSRSHHYRNALKYLQRMSGK